MKSRPSEQLFGFGVYGFVICACAFAAYLGLTLPLLDGQARTLEFDRIEWNSSAPMETVSLSGMVATSSNGSRMNRIRYTDRVLSFSGEHGERRSIYTPAAHVSYVIDDIERTVRVIPCTCDWERSAWPVDAQCSSAAKKYNQDLIYTGSDRIASVPVIGYRAFDHIHFAELAFAPSLHCEVMEEFRIVFGVGLEKSYSHFKVTNYVSGEPPVSTFTPPLNYRFEP